MPNKSQGWDPETKRGNPTRSKDINNFIKRVKEASETAEVEAKKRKREEDPTSTPITVLPLQPATQLTLPSAHSAMTAPLHTAVATHNAVPVQNILRRMVAQNSQLIELFGTFSETMKQFQTNLRINNQQMLAEIDALGAVAPASMKQPEFGDDEPTTV